MVGAARKGTAGNAAGQDGTKGNARSEIASGTTGQISSGPRQPGKTVTGRLDRSAAANQNRPAATGGEDSAEAVRQPAGSRQTTPEPRAATGEPLRKEDTTSCVRARVPAEEEEPSESASSTAADATAPLSPASNAVLDTGPLPLALPAAGQRPVQGAAETTADASLPAASPTPPATLPPAARQDGSGTGPSTTFGTALSGAAATAARKDRASSPSPEKASSDAVAALDTDSPDSGADSAHSTKLVPAGRLPAESGAQTKTGTIQPSSAATYLNGREPALVFAARLILAESGRDNATANSTPLPEKHLALPAEILPSGTQRAQAGGTASQPSEQSAPDTATAAQPDAAQTATGMVAQTPEPAAGALPASAADTHRQRAAAETSDRPVEVESQAAGEGAAATMHNAGTGIVPSLRAEGGRTAGDSKTAADAGLLKAGWSVSDSRLPLETSQTVFRTASLNGLSFVVRGRSEQGSTDSQVEVRVTGRTGEVQVDVRTADERLGEALRDTSADLIARLAAHGYRTERLNSVDAAPAGQTARASQGSASVAQSKPGGSGDSQNAGQGGGAGQQPRQGNGRRDPGGTPWVSILETARASEHSEAMPEKGAGGIEAQLGRTS